MIGDMCVEYVDLYIIGLGVSPRSDLESQRQATARQPHYPFFYIKSVM